MGMMKTIAKGPFLGINNRLPDFALHVKDKGDYLHEAINVDINNADNIRRRKATALIQAMTGAHSLFTAGDGTRYLVRGSVLYVVTLPAYTETLFKILTSDAAMSYIEYGGSLYFSNGTDSGRIASGVWYPMALPTPAAPVVASVPGGELYAGRYQVVTTYCRMSGADLLEEGGCSPVGYYDLAAVGGLRIPLPSATAGATHAAVYVSTVNGSVPMRVATVVLGTATIDVTLQAELAIGRDADQRKEQPLPAGKLFVGNGMLCSYSGSEVYEGIPGRLGYYVPLTERDLEGGRMIFPADVSNVLVTQGGTYVVSDKTYWFPGTRMTKTELVQDVLPYGGVPGTGFSYKFKSAQDQMIERVGWFGAEGIVIADQAGNATPVMADNVSLTPPASGVSAIFTAGGYRRVASCGWALNLSNLAATRYTDYDFTSISGNYATKADGIYDLNSTGEVAWLVDLGKENFGTETMKHLPAVYVGADSEMPVQLRVQAPGGVDYTYDARSSGTDTRIQRIDPGKGLRSNWFELSLLGESDFTLASVSFAPIASTRRI
jgi:hypothetical protein